MNQKRFGRYEIKGVIGRGGMATVYHAYDPRFERDVAIKVLPGEVLDDPQFRTRFEREAKAVAMLEHSAIVPVYDFGEEEGQPYIVMRYLAGGSLAERLKKGPMPVDETIRMISRLASALDAAHKRGIIHRDIKPGNILFDQYGAVFLSDFGIARLKETSGVATLTGGAILGTPAYMSPEQVQGDAVVDGRSDIYALGVILFQALTGRTPYEADTPAKVMMMHLLEPVPTILDKKTDLPPSFEAVIERSMAKQPSERYPTAGELAGALETAVSKAGLSTRISPTAPGESSATVLSPPKGEAQTSKAPAASPASATGQGARFPTWAWVAGGVAVILVLGAIVLGSGLAYLSLRPTPSATPTHTIPPATSTPTGTATQAATATATATPTPTIAPTGTPTSIVWPALPLLVGTPVPAPVSVVDTDTARNVVQVARWGKGTVERVVFSPDGQYLAVSAALGIYLYDTETMAEVRFIETVSEAYGIAFSPNGEILAVGFSDRKIRLWRVSDGAPLRTLEGHTSGVEILVFSPDGETLASGSWDKTVRLWRYSDGESLYTLEGHTSSVQALAFSPDGELLASGAWDRSARIWRVSDGELVYALEEFAEYEDIIGLAFSSDSEVLYLGSDDDVIYIYWAADGTLLETIPGAWNWSRVVSFSADGEVYATANYNMVELRSTSDSSALRTFSGPTDYIPTIAISPDRSKVAAGSGDGSVRLWRMADGEPLGTIEGFSSYMLSVAFSPDGGTLATGSADSKVRLWRIADGALIRTLEGHTDYVRSVVFSPDGETLASGSDDSTVRLWRISDGATLRVFEGHDDYVQCAAFSPDGTLLASASDDSTVKIWRVYDGALLHTLEGHTDYVYSVAFSPDGEMLASGSLDSTVRLWRVSDGSPLLALERHSSDVTSVAFSPDGELLASGSYDDTIRLWRVSDGASVRAIERDMGGVEYVVFSPDGTLLASGGWDDKVRLWRVSDGELLHTLEGPTDGVNWVAFSPDQKMLAIASWDGTVRLWAVAP